MKRLFFILIMCVLFPSVGWSFFHFEPGIGYNRGSYQATKSQGIGLTTKLGAEFTKFFLVADVGYHDLQLGSTPSSTAIDMGLCIGGDFKSWRFWYTYLVGASLAVDSGGVTSKYSGDGMKLGISGRVAKKAFINLEVRFIDLTDLDGTPIQQLMTVGMLSLSWKLL